MFKNLRARAEEEEEKKQEEEEEKEEEEASMARDMWHPPLPWPPFYCHGIVQIFRLLFPIRTHSGHIPDTF